MKLFQQMLVVGATLGLIAPISAQASNIVDLEEMNSYSRSKKNSSRIDSNTFTNKISNSNSSQKKSSAGLQARSEHANQRWVFFDLN